MNSAPKVPRPIADTRPKPSILLEALALERAATGKIRARGSQPRIDDTGLVGTTLLIGGS